MNFLNKAKDALSNLGEETIAEASFEKDEEPKVEKPKAKRRVKPKKPATEKKERKPRIQRHTKEEEYVEINVTVEDTKYNTFRDGRGKGEKDILNHEDFKKAKEQEHYDDEEYVDEVEDEEEIDSDTDFLDGRSRGARVEYENE